MPDSLIPNNTYVSNGFAYEIEEGGYISSGTLLPTSQKSVALAMVPLEYTAIGSTVHVRIRQHRVPATVTALPFL